MKDFTVFFVILIIATILYIYLERRSLEVTYVKSKTGDTFLVRKGPDQAKAAELLSRICNNITILINHLIKNKHKYSNHYKEGIVRLKHNFNREKVYENSNHQKKSTSYSINKGSKIIFCIRQKEINELLDINTMMFVAIHECSHLMSESIGHNKEFWDNMVFLLKEGEKCKIYNYINYNKSPQEYCGMIINDTPWHRN
jgi:hypothetical protein